MKIQRQLLCRIGLLLGTTTVAFSLSAQEATVAFYNVENLFDTQDDSLTQDEEFLPYGVRGWTHKRLHTKYRHLYKVIAGIAPHWQPPALVALAEVENRSVLEGLLRHTPLHRHYRIIHEESPDRRGIDVALLFDPAQFQYLHHETIPVNLHPLSDRPTRDILYVRGVLFETDTIHYFINHWPSRYSGVTPSAPLRQRAATVLRDRLRVLQSVCPDALVIVAGDFNDNPADESVRMLCDTRAFSREMVNISDYDQLGTHKYQGEWNTFDQFLVSQNLLSTTSSVYVKDRRARVYDPSWLLEEDHAQLGFRPRRTYVGYRYQGGFSDHLPVYIQLREKSAEVAGK